MAALRCPLLFSFLFLTFCCSSPGTSQCHRARGVACDVPLAPATHLLGLAMDVTTLESPGGRVLQLEEEEEEEDGGHQEALGDATCVLCPDLLAGGHRLRRLPPGVGGWRSGRRCRQRSRVAGGREALGTAVAGTQEVARGWRVGLLLRPPGPAAGGGVTVAGSHSRVAQFGLQRLREDRYDFASLEISCVFYWTRVSPSARPSPHFLRAVRALPPAFTPATAADYEELLAAYGTHYIRGAQLGGRLRAVTAIRTCRAAMAGASSQEVADCLGVEVSAGGGASRAGAMAEACRRARGGNQGNASFNEAFGERLVEVEGGEQDGDLLYGRPEAYTKWLQSLPALPGLVAAEVRPLHTLLSRRDPRRGSLRAAVGHYVSRRALRLNCSQACPGGHVAGPCRCACPAHHGDGGGGGAAITPDCCSRRRGLARLRVWVGGGRGWRGDHIFSKTDAYVRVFFGGRQARTPTLWNDDRPRWALWLDLGTVELLGGGGGLRVEVWDEDNRWDDDLLGVCQVAPVAGVGKREVVCYPGGGRLELGYEATCGPALGGPFCHDYVPQSHPAVMATATAMGDGGLSWPPAPGDAGHPVEWPQEEEEEKEEAEGTELGWEEEEEEELGEATDAFGDLPEPLGVFEEGPWEVEPASDSEEGPSEPQGPSSIFREGSPGLQDPSLVSMEGSSGLQAPSLVSTEGSSEVEPKLDSKEGPSEPQGPSSIFREGSPGLQAPSLVFEEGSSDLQAPSLAFKEGPSGLQAPSLVSTEGSSEVEPPSGPKEGPSEPQGPSLAFKEGSVGQDPPSSHPTEVPPAPRRFLPPHSRSLQGRSFRASGSPGGSSRAGPTFRPHRRSPRPIEGPPAP